jgi:hypothetical protein
LFRPQDTTGVKTFSSAPGEKMQAQKTGNAFAQWALKQDKFTRAVRQAVPEDERLSSHKTA